VRPNALEWLLERSDTLALGNRAALVRIVALCDEDSATPSGIALEAARDEGFAALLMRLANSADSGSVTRVSELTTAVVRLGLRLVQGLALAAPGLRLLSGPNDGLGSARVELHRHAVRTGLAARLLAPAGVEPEQALAAGLLHNIGLNVLSLCEPQLFAAAVANIDSERAEIGFTHAELGARLAERWSYPRALADAIHEHDSDAPTTQLAAVVHVADRLVRQAGIGVEPAVDPTPAALELAGVASLTEAQERLEPLLAAQDRFDAFQG
jgi:HD-like signal output (HDOD) protein